MPRVSQSSGFCDWLTNRYLQFVQKWNTLYPEELVCYQRDFGEK